MVNLIIGKKGSGKTKKLIELTNKAVKSSNGNVVVLEKGTQLTYDLTHAARLIDADEYGISGFAMLYGFLGGICAGNYDVTDIFIDSTLKICGNDMNEFSEFVGKVKNLSEKSETNIYVLVSSGEVTIPSDLGVEYTEL